MTRNKCLLIVVPAVWLVSACGTGKAGEVQVVEVVEGTRITTAPDESVMSQEHAPAGASTHAPKEGFVENASIAERDRLVPNHEVYVQRALQPDAPDMAQGTAASTHGE